MDPDTLLLPTPRSHRRTGGACHLGSDFHLHAPAPREPVLTHALTALDDAWVQAVGGPLLPIDGDADQRVVRLLPADTPADAATTAGQAYRLVIEPAAVTLHAATPVGWAYGLHTLAQLVTLSGRELPCTVIEDEPAFATRGVSYDISRGRVPTLAFLQTLVERFAALRINHLQLYTEHTFDWQFDPAIAAGCSPLTAAELRTLDAFAAERGVTLTPSLATCGHMARVLSVPAYRALAEIEPANQKSFEQMTWRERVRGLTLDVTNPASRKLLTQMLDEYLPCFANEQVNVCCDETFDLGQGRGRPRAEAEGAAQLFLEHLQWLREAAGRHGKRILYWGDMLKKYPEAIQGLPRDGTLLHWAYDASDDFDSTATFTFAGLDTWVCPGTSTWNRFVSDLPTAELNIRRFAKAGRMHHAGGLLNTEWGDDGHIAPPATSSYAFALGAAVAWNPDTPPAETFDAAYCRWAFAAGGEAILRDWRQLAGLSAMTRSWPMCYAPLPQTSDAESWADDALIRWQDAAADLAHRVSRLNASGGPWFDPTDREELELGFALQAWAAQRLRLGRAVAAASGSVTGRLRDDLTAFAAETRALSARYAANWLAHHKPSYLHELQAALERLAAEADNA
jgi:hypothetical protein